MNKKQTIKTISLSTVLVAFLSSCGSSGGGTYSNTGKRLNSHEYKSCVDLNKNNSCEENEKSLNPNNYPTVDVTAYDNSHLMGLPGSDRVSVESTLLYNEIKFKLKSQYQASSILQSEYGGEINKDGMPYLNLSSEQRVYFKESLKNIINANPDENLTAVIAATCEKFKQVRHNIPKDYTTNTFSVSKDEIRSQKFVLTKLEVEKYDSKNWDLKTIKDTVGEVETGDVDLLNQLGAVKIAARKGLTDIQKDLVTAERIVSIKGSGNRLLTSSQYHNALSIVDYDENKEKLKYQKFAAFRVNYNTKTGGMYEPANGGTGGTGSTGSTGGTGGSGNTTGGTTGSSGASGGRSFNSSNLKVLSSKEYNKYEVSTETTNYHNYTDSRSDKKNTFGLWEHKLVDAQIDAYGKNVFALIKPKIDGLTFDYTYRTTFGLYKIDVGDHGVYPYSDSSTKKINSYDIDKFQLSNDGQKVVVYGKNNDKNFLRVLNGDLKFTQGTGIQVDDIQDFVITSNNKYILASIQGDYENKYKIIRFSTNNLKEKKELKLNYNIDRVFSYENGTKALVISKLDKKVVVIDLAYMKVLNEFSYDFVGRLFSMSQDGKYLAISSLDKINIYDLRSSLFNLAATIKEDISNIRGQKYNYETNYISLMNFIGNSLISYSKFQEKNGIKTYRIKDTKIIQNDSNKLQLALDHITKDRINSGYDFNNVTSDLKLIKSYEGADISYRVDSNLQGHLDPKTGKVTRDNSNNIEGKLLVIATIDGKTKEKLIKITILKDIPKIGSNISTISSIDTKILNSRTQKVCANLDSSFIVSYSLSTSRNKGFNIFKLEQNKLKALQGDGNSFVNNFDTSNLLNFTFRDDNTMIVATTNTHYPAKSEIYLQDINYDGTLASKNLSSVAYIGNFGTPISAVFNENKDKIAIFRKSIVEKPKNFYADIYSISGNRISKERTIRLKEADYQSLAKFSISNDGRVLYHIDQNFIYKNSYQNENKSDTISIKIDNLNGVYSFANRVYATTNKGTIVSLDENLNQSSKLEFGLGDGSIIKNLEYKNGKLYAFTSKGVYILNIDSSYKLSGDRIYPTNSVEGTALNNGGVLSIGSNSSSSSTISYSK